MGNVVQLPDLRSQSKEFDTQPVYYGERMRTSGESWTRREKKLLDRLEFLEAMVLVLDDVRLKNIRNRDYGMMSIVEEEIPRYMERIDEVRHELENLRARYNQSILAVGRG